MQKKGGLDIVIITVLLVLIAAVLAVAFFRWGGTYTQELTENAEENNGEAADAVVNSKIRIKDVSFTNFKSELKITLENQGKLPIETVIVKVTLDDGSVYSDFFPNRVEYPSGSLDLAFFNVKQFTVFFQEVQDITNYEKIEIIPTVRLENGNLEQVASAAQERYRQ